jgi:hypothetical protein
LTDEKEIKKLIDWGKTVVEFALKEKTQKSKVI